MSAARKWVGWASGLPFFASCGKLLTTRRSRTLFAGRAVSPPPRNNKAAPPVDSRFAAGCRERQAGGPPYPKHGDLPRECFVAVPWTPQALDCCGNRSSSRNAFGPRGQFQTLNRHTQPKQIP